MEVVSMARRRIRCLFVIDVLWGFAGTEKHLLQIVSGLDREEFECMVVAFRASDEMIKKYEDEFGKIDKPDAIKKFEKKRKKDSKKDTGARRPACGRAEKRRGGIGDLA